MQNVEFKAEVRDIEAARRQCTLIRATPGGTFAQIDTYFRVAEGRLKRRQSPGRSAEWIWYQRPDSLAVRTSRYTLLSDEQAAVRWGHASMVPWKVVRKIRERWMLDNIRIHLDQVEDVGTFIEFEAAVSPHYDLTECRAVVVQLREQFSPILGEPVGGSYESMVGELAESERGPSLP